MNEDKKLFKDTNPEAYSELKEAYISIQLEDDMSKEEIFTTSLSKLLQ